MDTKKEKFTSLQNRLFTLLCKRAGAILNQREIAGILKVSPTAVGKTIPTLAKEGLVFLRKEKVMNLNRVQLNRDSKRVLRLKRVENLNCLYESNLVDFLHDHFPGATIILFGSYAFGDDTTASDIDIAVVGSKEKELDLKTFEKNLERTININYYSSFKSIDVHLRNSLLNGIVLEGFIEL